MEAHTRIKEIELPPLEILVPILHQLPVVVTIRPNNSTFMDWRVEPRTEVAWAPLEDLHARLNPFEALRRLIKGDPCPMALRIPTVSVRIGTVASLPVLPM